MVHLVHFPLSGCPTWERVLENPNFFRDLGPVGLQPSFYCISKALDSAAWICRLIRAFACVILSDSIALFPEQKSALSPHIASAPMSCPVFGDSLTIWRKSLPPMILLSSHLLFFIILIYLTLSMLSPQRFCIHILNFCCSNSNTRAHHRHLIVSWWKENQVCPFLGWYLWSHSCISSHWGLS